MTELELYHTERYQASLSRRGITTYKLYLAKMYDLKQRIEDKKRMGQIGIACHSVEIDELVELTNFLFVRLSEKKKHRVQLKNLN